jgi:hypothetical protein
MAKILKAGGNPVKSRKKRKAKAAEPIDPAQLAGAPEVCPKVVLTKLMREAHKTDDVIGTARGVLGEQIAEATARNNLHRWAFKIARRLQRMSELKRAEAIFQLDHYIEALGLDSGDLFREPTGKRPPTRDEPELPAEELTDSTESAQTLQ